jgi:hypothetical protein
MPPPKPKIVGIELGTTYSLDAAYQPGDGTVDIYEDDDGRRCIPSVVAFTNEGPVVRLAANGQAQANARNTVYDAKRFIGKDFAPQIAIEAQRYPFQVVNSSDGTPEFQVESEGKPHTVTPEDIGGLILGQLRRTAEARIKGEFGKGWEGGVMGAFDRLRRGEPVLPVTWREDLEIWGRGEQPLTIAVMSVSSEFNQRQRDATQAAAAKVGLDVLRVISEDKRYRHVLSSTPVRKSSWRTSADGCIGPSCGPVFTVAHKTDDDDDDGASRVTSTVEDDLETLIQEALGVYQKIQKLDVMGGEEGLRKRILSYGAGLEPDDPQRVIRAQEFLELVKRRFAKRLINEF